MCEQHPLSMCIAELPNPCLSPPKLRQRDALARRPRALAPWARRGQPLAKLGSFISTVRPRLVQTHASRGHRRTGLAPGASAKLPTRGLSNGGGCGGDGGEGGGHGSGGDASCCGGGCGPGRSGCTTLEAAALHDHPRCASNRSLHGQRRPQRATVTAQPCGLRLSALIRHSCRL